MFKLIILLFISFSALANDDYNYDGHFLKIPNFFIYSKLNNLFLAESFYPLERNYERGFNTFKLNQIFFNAKGFITFKYNVKSDAPIDRVLNVANGHVIHLKIENSISSFYFSGFDFNYVNSFKNKLKKLSANKKVSHNYFIPSAQADCQYNEALDIAKDEVTDIKAISTSSIAANLMGCLKGTTEGVKDSLLDIPRLALSGLTFLKNETIDWFENPSKKASEYYQTVEKAMIGLKNFAAIFSEIFVNPVKARGLLIDKMGDVGEYFYNIFKSVAQLPMHLAIEIMCSFSAGVGADAIMTFFTFGAGAPKLALGIRRVAKSMDKLSSMFKWMNKSNISFSKIGLDKASQSKLFSALKEGRVSDKVLDTFSQAVQTESQLARSFALQGVKCSI